MFRMLTTSSFTIFFGELLCAKEDTAAGEAPMVVHLDGRGETDDLGDVVVFVVMQVDAPSGDVK